MGFNITDNIYLLLDGPVSGITWGDSAMFDTFQDSWDCDTYLCYDSVLQRSVRQAPSLSHKGG